MKKWQLVVIIISVALNMAVIATFSYLWAADHIKKSPYSEKELEEMKKKYASIRVVLDVPDLESQAVQLAYFNFDPIPAVHERAKSYVRIYTDYINRNIKDEAKESSRKMYTQFMWDDAFKDVNGDKVQLLTKGGASYGSNIADKKLWVVTKARHINDEPICWCIPVTPEIGKEITITLSKATAFDINQIFSDALSEAGKQVATQYPVDPNFKDEPTAHALYNKMIGSFQNANSIYFESVIWNGREGETYNKAYYRAWLKKPDLARIEAIKDGKVTGTLVCDGKYFWIYWGGKQTPFDSASLILYGTGKYMRLPAFQGDYQSLSYQVTLLEANIPRLIFELSRFKNDQPDPNKHLDGVRSIGNEMINGETCDVIEVIMPKNIRSIFYWISRNDYLPRKIREVIRRNGTFVMNELWSNVFINTNIPDALFSWKPPESWTQQIKPSWEENLLKPGATAPDFELKARDGKIIKLTNLKGNVILLSFWAYGSKSCRDELPVLERIYQRYKNKDFIVIGINNSDDYEIANNILNESAITYPNIIDASPSAQDIQYKKYQTIPGRSATPLTYLIDRDGEISEGWYDYNKGDEDSILKKLKKLGIK